MTCVEKKTLSFPSSYPLFFFLFSQNASLFWFTNAVPWCIRFRQTFLHCLHLSSTGFIPPFICCLSVFPLFCLNRKEMTHIHVCLSFLFSAALGQRVKVEPEVSSYPGQTVNLRCAFTDATGIQLTMVRYCFIIPFPPLANGLKWP